MSGVSNGQDGREEEAALRTYRHTDPTTAADRSRIRDARVEARERLREVRRDDAGTLRRIFQEEIGKNVRSASPFLSRSSRRRGIRSIDWSTGLRLRRGGRVRRPCRHARSSSSGVPASRIASSS